MIERAQQDLATFNSGGFTIPAASQAEADAREEAAKAHARAAMERIRTEPDLEPTIPTSEQERRWAAGGRLLERGEISRDEYAAVLNGDIPETIRAKLEQEMQSTPEGGSGK